MSTGGGSILPQLVLGLVAGGGLLAAALVLLARRSRMPKEAALGLGLVGLAVAVTLLVAESARWMLLPDGQNEEGAFVGLVAAAGGLSAWGWLLLRPARS